MENKDVLEKIMERKRQELIQAYNQAGNTLDISVLVKSQVLDRLIVQSYRQQNQNDKICQSINGRE